LEVHRDIFFGGVKGVRKRSGEQQQGGVGGNVVVQSETVYLRLLRGSVSKTRQCKGRGECRSRGPVVGIGKCKGTEQRLMTGGGEANY